MLEAYRDAAPRFREFGGDVDGQFVLVCEDPVLDLRVAVPVEEKAMLRYLFHSAWLAHVRQAMTAH